MNEFAQLQFAQCRLACVLQKSVDQAQHHEYVKRAVFRADSMFLEMVYRGALWRSQPLRANLE